MEQQPAIWFMEGMSSQRDLVLSTIQARQESGASFRVLASHRENRTEITSVADVGLVEPSDKDERLAFIVETVGKYNVKVIQAGRGCAWFEKNRNAIESTGVKLITGTRSELLHAIADDKVRFAALMQESGVPVVPSLRVDSLASLKAGMSHFGDLPVPLCLKPVTGIYGMGFWVLDPKADPMFAFEDADKRQVHPDVYFAALSQKSNGDEHAPYKPQVLMPYLPGPERSIDMVVEDGDVIAAVARMKEGRYQTLQNHGDAIALAKACAKAMHADGIVNVQTRNDHTGSPVVLEINLRPSGGSGWTMASGVNLAGIFALRQLGFMSREDAIQQALGRFVPAKFKTETNVQVLTGQHLPRHSNGAVA